MNNRRDETNRIVRAYVRLKSVSRGVQFGRVPYSSAFASLTPRERELYNRKFIDAKGDDRSGQRSLATNMQSERGPTRDKMQEPFLDGGYGTFSPEAIDRTVDEVLRRIFPQD